MLLNGSAIVITPPHSYLHEDALTSRSNHSVQFPVGWWPCFCVKSLFSWLNPVMWLGCTL